MPGPSWCEEGKTWEWGATVFSKTMLSVRVTLLSWCKCCPPLCSQLWPWLCDACPVGVRGDLRWPVQQPCTNRTGTVDQCPPLTLIWARPAGVPDTSWEVLVEPSPCANSGDATRYPVWPLPLACLAHVTSLQGQLPYMSQHPGLSPD